MKGKRGKFYPWGKTLKYGRAASPSGHNLKGIRISVCLFQLTDYIIWVLMFDKLNY
jgi:hypothetical protein